MSCGTGDTLPISFSTVVNSSEWSIGDLVPSCCIVGVSIVVVLFSCIVGVCIMVVLSCWIAVFSISHVVDSLGGLI